MSSFDQKIEEMLWNLQPECDDLVPDTIDQIKKLISEIIGEDEYEPKPSDFIVTEGLNHFAIAKGRNILKKELRHAFNLKEE